MQTAPVPDQTEKKQMKMQKLLMVLGLAMLAGNSWAGDRWQEGFYAAEKMQYQKAVQQWGPLADSGDANAQFNIAMMYHSGAGVPANEAEAVRWYLLAAKNGHPQAMEYLAAAYLNGWFGLKKDLKKAAYWEEQSYQ